MYLTLYILVQKSVWRSSESRVGLASKRQVWSILFLFEIYDHVSKGKFGPLSNCSKRQVWSRFGEKSGPNLPFPNISHTWFKLFKKGKFGPDFSPNLDQTCLFEQFKCGPNLPFDTWSKISKRKKVDQTCLFEATPHVILDSFKHFSGPKYKTIRIKLIVSMVHYHYNSNHEEHFGGRILDQEELWQLHHW